LVDLENVRAVAGGAQNGVWVRLLLAVTVAWAEGGTWMDEGMATVRKKRYNLILLARS
jgi:hypothetical protein